MKVEDFLKELRSDPNYLSTLVGFNRGKPLQSLLAVGSVEQKNEYFTLIGVDIESFYLEVEKAIGELPDKNGTKLSTQANYNPDTIVLLLKEKQEDFLDILIKFSIEQQRQSGSNVIRIDDYLASPAGQSFLRDKINEFSQEESQAFFGLLPGQVSLDNNFGSAVLREINAIVGVPEPEDPEEIKKKTEDISDAQAKQCVLLNLLDPLSKLCDLEMFNKTNPSGYPGMNTVGYPYSGRIVKMNCDNPSTFINYLSSVSGSNQNLAEKKAKENLTNKKTTLDYRLSFVRSYNDELVELPVFFAGGFNYSEGKDGVLMKPTSDLPNKVIQKTTKFDVDVKYEGTNPSTYRSDVDVTITIASNTMATFLQKWKYDGYVDDDNNQIPFTLFDLILFPYLEKDSKGYGKAYKSQYSPSYNRLRLTYTNKMSAQAGRDADMVSFFEKNVNVLDLAIVDHEFKRDEEGKNHELVITYRGYVQSVLTSPETDVLSTPDIKEKRRQRDELLRQAIEKNCSLREIQSIQQQLNRLAQADVEDVTNGIMGYLYARGIFPSIMGLGIYKLDLNPSISSGLLDGNDIKLEEIKKFIVNGKGDKIKSSSPTTATVVGTNQLQTFATDVAEGGKQVYFFYLADLLDAAILNSSIFRDRHPKDDPINKDVIAQKIRFIFGTFRGPPTNGNPNGEFYNIGNIPISVDYFLEWYKQNVTDKELFIYPCLSFIRDISETVVTNMLNEVCYEALEETKAVVRTSFFTGAKVDNKEPLYETIANYYFNRTNGKQIDLDSLTDEKFPLIRPSFKENVKDYVNYCAIYTRESRSRALNISRNVEIINYKYDYPEKYFGAETIAFSRTSQPGLRESRYERNSNSGITMLAGVYNASIKLTHPLNFIYPGQFFQISLYEPPDFDIRLPNGSNIGIFTELGLNGYYSVTKTSHKLNMKNRTNQVTVDGIWIGSKSPYDTRQTGGVSSITSPNQTACNEYVELANEIPFIQQSGVQNALQSEINKLNTALPPPTAGSAAPQPSIPNSSQQTPNQQSSQPQTPPPTPTTTAAPQTTPTIGSSNSTPSNYDLD